MHEGSLLRNLVKDLKRENGTTRADIAGKMGITPEHLSTVFNRERLTAEIKSRAIRALSLPPDYFDEKQQEPPPPSREEALNALREDSHYLQATKTRTAGQRHFVGCPAVYFGEGGGVSGMKKPPHLRGKAAEITPKNQMKTLQI